jgi:transcriptional regulator with XRE-family HTH domain
MARSDMPGTPEDPQRILPTPRESEDLAEEPAILRIMLGLQLRRLREGRSVSAADAAKAIRATPSKISRIELGRSAIREIDVLDLLTLYGVDLADREHFFRLAEQAGRPRWWHQYRDILPPWFQTYIGMEQSAKVIRAYEPLFVPGLLQTPEYAAAVLALGDIPAAAAERHVMLRRERQRRFNEGQLRLWIIIDESALRRPVGSVKILHDQLNYLLSLSTRQNLTLQITPMGAGGNAAPSAFTILRFNDPELPDVVYVELLTGATYVEKKEDIDRYLMAMERVSITSAKPVQTHAILTAIIRQLEEHSDAGRPSSLHSWLGLGKAEAAGDGGDGVAESPDQRFAAAAALVTDPVASGNTPGGDGELGQDVEPEVIRVEAELDCEAVGYLPLDGGTVVLGVGQQRGFAGDEVPGGDEALVPAGVESGRGLGQGVVQSGQDGCREGTLGQGGQVGGPQLGLGLDRRRLLGREEAEERALGHLCLVRELVDGGGVVALLGE